MDQLTVLEVLRGQSDFLWLMCLGYQIDGKEFRWCRMESRARRSNGVACVSEKSRHRRRDLCQVTMKVKVFGWQSGPMRQVKGP